MPASDLDARYWNPIIRDGRDWALATLKYLKDAIGAAGYKPGREPPVPDIRYLLYTIRPIEEWRLLVRSDPDQAMDDIKDFANIARRRNQPEAALEASRAVLSELAPQGIPGG
jgi:hypothetical protein